MKPLFRRLFDFSFETFLTDRLVKFLYPLSVAAAGVVSVLLIVGGFLLSPWAGVFMLIVGGPLLFLLGVVYTRAVLEIMIVFFRLMDDVTRLTETLEQSSAPPPERREKREREFEDYPPAL